MKITENTDIFGITDTTFAWSPQERATLLKAADLLAQAREMVDPESDLGTDLGKGEVVLRDWLDGALIATEIGPPELLFR